MKQLFANNAGTTLAGGITNTSTSLNVASGGGALFPTPAANQYFAATLIDAATGLVREIIWVTARAGDTMTIVRGQEGTTAENWLAGDLLQMLNTAGTMANLSQTEAAQSQATNYAVDTGAVNAYVVALTPALTAAVPGMPIRVKIKTGNGNTGASTLDAGYGVQPIINPDGTAIPSGTVSGDGEYTFEDDGAGNFQLTSASNALRGLISVPGTGGQLQFVSPTQLTLAPFNGGLLWIDNVNYQIPAALNLSNGGLTASALYYVYAYMNAGVMTLEASGVGYGLASNGMPQKIGDATRTLVGLIYVNSSGQFADTDGTRYVLSWFNRTKKRSRTNFTGSPTNTATTFVEISTTIRNYFLVWAGENVDFGFTGHVTSSSATAVSVVSAISFDSGPIELETGDAETYGASTGFAINFGGTKVGLAEGLHVATIYGGNGSANTATWVGGSSPPALPGDGGPGCLTINVDG